jgi:hypothetical protein
VSPVRVALRLCLIAFAGWAIMRAAIVLGVVRW